MNPSRSECIVAKLQKNPTRLNNQLRQQPSIELWKKWAHEIREELYLHWDMNQMLPVQGSRLKVVDKHRRMFDSHGSNLMEAILMPDNHPTYWLKLSEHEGGSYASEEKTSQTAAWDAMSMLVKSPTFNPDTFEVIWERYVAKNLR